MVSYSGLGKTRLDPLPVRVVYETVGVPLKYFPLACEFAGGSARWNLVAANRTRGRNWVLYFLGAIVSHLRVGDIKGIRHYQCDTGGERRS